MSIMVSDNGGDFERPNPGWHQAVCTNVYGPFQESYEWQGKTITAKKIVIMYELEQRIEKGDFKDQRFTISSRFTASLNDKGKLRPFLESWRGKAFTPDQLTAFDLENLIGVNCQLNLIEKDKRGGGKTVVIASIGPAQKEKEKIVPELTRDFAPKWISDILAAQKPEASHSSKPDNFEDDIPF